MELRLVCLSASVPAHHMSCSILPQAVLLTVIQHYRNSLICFNPLLGDQGKASQVRALHCAPVKQLLAKLFLDIKLMEDCCSCRKSKNKQQQIFQDHLLWTHFYLVLVPFLCWNGPDFIIKEEIHFICGSGSQGRTNLPAEGNHKPLPGLYVFLNCA